LFARSLPARILAGAVAAVLAFLLRGLVVHFTGSLPPFLVFMPTVILVALSLGIWAGLAVTFTSALLGDYFLLPPLGSFRLAHSSDVFVLFHFTAVGIFTSVLSELYRRKNDRIARLQTAEAVRAERLITAEHAAANARLEEQAVRLRETEQLLTTLVTFVPEILWMCTPQGDNIYFNQRWVDYTGLTPEESAGTNWIRPFHPDDAPAAREAWAEAVRTGNDYQLEARLRSAAGHYRWFLLRAAR
jgi:PAS domain S-box-containing protein